MHKAFQRRFLIPFRTGLLPQIFTDTLVIGCGVAGLRAAIAAAEHGEVIILSKDRPQRSNTAVAQGGIAAVWAKDDSLDAHVADTMNAGAGLCDEAAVRFILQRGPGLMRELADWGMPFDRAPDGSVALGREGAHSHARILHSGGDASGSQLSAALLARVRQTAQVRLFEDCFALDLLTPADAPGAPVMGAITHHPHYGLQVIWARATILASGGAGMVYRETTNPPSATGDGLAMAWRAGAPIADMAFVQFHPTTLYLAGAPRFLISEAARGEGGLLVDHSGRRFMLQEHELAELAPRDVVARAIVRRVRDEGATHVFLDVRAIDGFAQRFPGITDVLHKYGLDPASDLIPVNPAAHYSVGGVATDLAGRTAVPGLYAAGEVAATGLHGANRLASNSLLEGLVMGEAAGRAARERTQGVTPDDLPPCPWLDAPPAAPARIVSDIPISDHAEIDLPDVLSSLRSCMWHNTGIERRAAALADAGDMLDFWARYTLDKIFDERDGWEVQNMLLVGALITASASWRAESRGCHWRADVPESLERLCAHDQWQRGGDGPQIRPVGAPAPAGATTGLR
ncbi:MAG: L-aspartate oxidase [Phycisphaerales bacterium JB039]